jgi:tetratricopeptide (TPR) repeat protein
MLAASPITRQSVGRTFTVAVSVLGAVAAVQFGVLVWAFIARQQPPSQAPFVGSGSPAISPVTTSPQPGAPVAVENPNFAADPLSLTGPTNSTEPVTTVAGLTPARPTPLPARPPAMPEPEQSARFKETIGLGKLLRDRGDMTTALTRFREAAAMDPKSPEAIYEIAVTFGKMQLADKAAEQWRRIFDMGESAGPYYTAAEARLNQEKQSAMIQATPSVAPTAESEEGITPGKTLGILHVTTEDQEDRTAAKHLALRIPIKARAREKVDVRDLTIQVLFYDIVDNQNLVQTTANVSSRWTSAPPDWLDTNLETLEVDYQLPLPEAKGARKENRKYFGYLIRLYYKGELQASAGEPEKLVLQFPPEPRLPDDVNKK